MTYKTTFRIARLSGKQVLINSINQSIIVKRAFLKGVSDIYKGEILLGEDGMAFTLDPKK